MTQCCSRSLGLRHRHALPCRPEDITGIDYLLLSHGHRDHLDEQSIKLLARQNPQMQVLCPLSMTKLLRGMAPALQVQEAGWWQQYDLGGNAAAGNHLLTRFPLAPPRPHRHEPRALGQLYDCATADKLLLLLRRQ